MLDNTNTSNVVIEEKQGNEVAQQNNTEDKQGYFVDPYMAQFLIMKSEMYIVYNYPHLVTVNQKYFQEGLNEIPDDAAIYLIKSCTEEDTHKAIKYNLWSSTNYGNNKLNKEFETKPVYLLFSTYKSNQFTGLAKMKSSVNFKNTFPLWARDNWRGTFDIQWLLIKDVPFKQFKNVECEKREKKDNGEYNFINYSTKSLCNSPDCQKIPTSEGKEIIKLMADYQNKNSILEHFEYYDIRQKNYESVVSKDNQHHSRHHQNRNHNNYHSNNRYNKNYYNKNNYYNNNYNNKYHNKNNHYDNYNKYYDNKNNTHVESTQQSNENQENKN